MPSATRLPAAIKPGSIEKAYIANHYIHACITGALAQGVAAHTLLRQAGIPLHWYQKPDQLITEQQLSNLIKAVWRETHDEFMGLAPSVCKNGVFALMAELAQQARTLGGMLKKSARFYSTVYPDIDAHLDAEQITESGQTQVFFRLQLQDACKDPNHLLQEFLILMWQRFSSWLTGQQIPFSRTCFSYPPPPHAREYPAMYTGTLEYNVCHCGFYLHPRYLQLPIVRSEEELNEFLNQSPAMILHRPDQDERLKTRIRMLLLQFDFDQLPDLDWISDKLHIAPRTLRRKLTEEGTSLRELKEQLRRDLAIKLLSSEHLGVNEVSERVGFSETAAFCRAFKRWTGYSPSKWRSPS
ncbi:AraC family transcriptional regulator [Oceanospirillum sp.]|uniref:AraC family transcriptional regulator n=1 Tax=Oceanospirillum sp. TaxID=2021254 RepID=UPI003A910C3B